MNIVIVESPAKAKTINKYLGPGYQVLASYGHVRDLPENPGKGKFGVDVEHDFAPEYVIPEDRRKQVSAIEKAARTADDVYLATDLDREGEAIAWHVAEAAKVPDGKARRVTFSEITEPAIRAAFASPRTIDRHLVDAQQTRRIVDRLVGYTLSPLLSRKIRGGLSAGRVQSVALRMVVEREREISAFVPREYWTLEALLRTPRGDPFIADIVRVDGRPLDVGTGDEARGHADALRSIRPTVDSLTVRASKRNPAPPFTTSTLQQEASRKLGFSPKRTMSIAQRLYEGVDTPNGHVGVITYMRTDSTAIAGVAMAEAQRVIGDRFGPAYGIGKGRVYRTRTKGAQEAHESIRPTSFARDPDSLRAHLKPEELRLYRLIWQRAIASQMAPKELETTTAELSAGRYQLRASATRTTFDGFARVYTEGRDDEAEEAERTLPPLAEGEATTVDSVTPTQHFTEPPPRFTEATLIKALEEHGIGRPSTYAAIVSTIVDREYVKVEERRLRPTEIGEIVTDLLVEHFGEYVDLRFTARMEEELDEIARGERAWVPLLRDFFAPLKARVDEKRRELRRADFTTEPTDDLPKIDWPKRPPVFKRDLSEWVTDFRLEVPLPNGTPAPLLALLTGLLTGSPSASSSGTYAPQAAAALSDIGAMTGTRPSVAREFTGSTLSEITPFSNVALPSGASVGHGSGTRPPIKTGASSGDTMSRLNELFPDDGDSAFVPDKNDITSILNRLLPDEEGSSSGLAPADGNSSESSGRLNAQHTTTGHSLFLAKIGDEGRREKAVPLIAELAKITKEEAEALSKKVIIPVLKGATKEEAEAAKQRFAKIGILARIKGAGDR